MEKESKGKLYDAVKPINIQKTVSKNLVMGGVAGIIGATTCYPIDMVKTRLQNQRTLPGQEKMYKNGIDCLSKIVRHEGIRGLYRGLPAQLVGITPEKAIKLTINDLLRYLFTDKKTGDIKIWQEAIAGASGGFSQVIVTNPYEFVKIRLQTQGIQAQQRKSAITIVQELGFRGLYKGAGACLLRDVPFSAIYFTLYARLKKAVKPVDGPLKLHQLFLCSSFAGTISAFAVTPADVVKTRLQVASSGDREPYKGVMDTFSRIIKEEGPKALFKGSVPRMLIISPLFGITLTTYELLQGFFL